jgi:hypothetical protein
MKPTQKNLRAECKRVLGQHYFSFRKHYDGGVLLCLHKFRWQSVRWTEQHVFRVRRQDCKQARRTAVVRALAWLATQPDNTAP